MQLDVNKSGYVTKDDWLRLGYRVAEKNGYDIQRNPKGDRFIPSSITSSHNVDNLDNRDNQLSKIVLISSQYCRFLTT